MVVETGPVLSEKVSKRQSEPTQLAVELTEKK